MVRIMVLVAVSAVGASAQTLTLPGSALTVTFAEDPSTGWNLQSAEVTGSAPGTAIPIHNIAVGLSIWEVRVFDGSGTPIIVNPVNAAASGATVSSSSSVMGTIASFSWTMVWPSGPIDTLSVTLLVGALPNDNEFLWLPTVQLMPRAGSSLSVEKFECPRLAIGAIGQDKRDKLYIPAREGALVSNYTSALFSIADGNEIYDPDGIRVTHQQWAVYHTESNPSYAGLNLDHNLSDSQLLFMGSRDAQGFAKSVRANTRLDTSSGTRYLEWIASNYPAMNRDPTPAPSTYTTMDLQTFEGYVWSTGVLPTGSDWYDVLRRYREWSTNARWWFEGEPPHRLEKLSSPLSGLSPRVRDASLMLIYAANENQCGGDHTNAIANDVRAWKSFMVDDISMAADADQLLTLHYRHILESAITRDGVDKFVDLADISQLSPRSNSSWTTEMAALATVPGVSSAIYAYVEGWDTTAPTWIGSPPTISPTLPIAPLFGPSIPCSPPITCVPAWPATVQHLPQLRFSYQMGETGALGNVHRWRSECDDSTIICPASNQTYRDAVWTALHQYVALTRQSLGVSGSILSGVYFDNMFSPSEPICQYRPLTTHPEDTDHDHPRGGGRYWMSQRRGIMKRLRKSMRQFMDPTAFHVSEWPSEYLIGAVDLFGSYVHGSGNHWSNFSAPGILTAPWVTSFPLVPDHDIVTIPGFKTVYGDYTLSFEWRLQAPDQKVMATLPEPPVYPDNLIPSGMYGTHPGTPEWGFLCLYNSYRLDQLGVADIAACPMIDLQGLLGAPYFAHEKIGIIGESQVPADQWENFLWISAYLGSADYAQSFHFKNQMTSVNFRNRSPIYPYHLNNDPTLQGLGEALIKDAPHWRFLQQLQKVRSDWRPYYMFGPRMRQPLIEPTAHADFINRYSKDVRDATLASCHAHTTASHDSVIIVTNWTPWPIAFDVHFDPADSGFTTTLPTTATEHEPDIGLGAAPSGPVSLTMSSVPGHMMLTTSVIPPAAVRVYRLQ